MYFIIYHKLCHHQLFWLILLLMIYKELKILFQLLIHLLGLPSVCGQKIVDNFILISNILFSFFVNSAANYDSLSDTTLFGNPCNFHILSLNSLVNLSANVPSIVATKCVILNNLLQTTRIVSFPATSGNLVIKLTIKCVHSFSGTSLSFNFPATSSILFFIL